MAAQEAPRLAGPADARVLAGLMHEFNEEFDVPTPGPDVLAPRLERLLAGEATAALLAGDPAFGFALLTLRPNVWYAGPVGLLDELYVRPARRDEGYGTALLARATALVREADGELLEINVDEGDTDARRFYERHGFSLTGSGQEESGPVLLQGAVDTRDPHRVSRPSACMSSWVISSRRRGSSVPADMQWPTCPSASPSATLLRAAWTAAICWRMSGHQRSSSTMPWRPRTCPSIRRSRFCNWSLVVVYPRAEALAISEEESIHGAYPGVYSLASILPPSTKEQR